MADTLAALRSLMSSHSPSLHALIIPSEDYHQVPSLFLQFFVISSNLPFNCVIGWYDRANMYRHGTKDAHLFLDSPEVLVCFCFFSITSLRVDLIVFVCGISAEKLIRPRFGAYNHGWSTFMDRWQVFLTGSSAAQWPVEAHAYGRRSSRWYLDGQCDYSSLCSSIFHLCLFYIYVNHKLCETNIFYTFLPCLACCLVCIRTAVV